MTDTLLTPGCNDCICVAPRCVADIFDEWAAIAQLPMILEQPVLLSGFQPPPLSFAQQYAGSYILNRTLVTTNLIRWAFFSVQNGTFEFPGSSTVWTRLELTAQVQLKKQVNLSQGESDKNLEVFFLVNYSCCPDFFGNPSQSRLLARFSAQTNCNFQIDGSLVIPPLGVGVPNLGSSYLKITINNRLYQSSANVGPWLLQ